MADNKTPVRVVIRGENGAGDQVFEADTKQALIEKLAQAQEHATRKIQEQHAVIEQNQYSKAQAAAVLTGAPQEIQGSNFDRQDYFNTLYQDPLRAFDKALEARFGMPADELVERLRYVEEAANLGVQQQIRAAFGRRHPELLQVSQQDDEHNGKIVQEILNANNWPFTIESLEAAYQSAKGQGKLKLPAGDQAVSQQSHQQIAQQVTAPSVISRPSAEQPEGFDEEKFLRTAPLHEARAYLEKAYPTGAGVRR